MPPSKEPNRGDGNLLGPMEILPPVHGLEWRKERSAGDYLQSLLVQIGNRGLAETSVHDFHLLAHHELALGELMRWRDQHPNPAWDQLHDWKNLDVERLLERRRATPGRLRALPRIDLTAEITSKDNLSVRWYPSGFLERRLRPRERDEDPLNKLDGCDLPDPPDFVWFQGDEEGLKGTRPSNELMFIRGVGRLHILASHETLGSRYGANAVNELLICAVRASFNGLIDALRRTHEVTLRHDFRFEAETVDTLDQTLPLAKTRERLCKWRLDAIKIPERWADKRRGEVIAFPGQS
jgi:hypothetical protein|uniref:Uncharacterized protein n=1 Tax=Caulobacter sp. (strain K31) TaxID=366602 RepID=B0T6V4_CAUSK